MRLTLLMILALLGFTSGGWMLFDGGRRLIVGDYVRIHGQLGPWTHVFRLIRVDPMSAGVAVLFIACATFRLLATVGLLCGARWSWLAMIASSWAILWYLPMGTINAGLTLVVLLVYAGVVAYGPGPGGGS